MIKIDSNSNIPIYVQIVDNVKEKVLDGTLKANEQLPSIRELAVTLGVNPNTVKKSYDILESQHLVQSFSTKGTYVTDKIDLVLEERANNSFFHILEEVNKLRKMGVSLETVLKKVESSWLM